MYRAINVESHFVEKPKKRFKIKPYYSLLLIPLAWWISTHFGLVINQTTSLPQKIWIMVLNQKPKKGDYIAFRPHSKTELSQNIILHKQVLGVAGDKVTRQERNFYINGQYVATAKTHSLKGELLSLGSEGEIPEGKYYVSTPHKDSFDSRYEKMGWIKEEQIIGVAYPIW